MACNLCPRMCQINREEQEGYCGCTNKIKVSRCAKHYFEEPILEGTKGSGAIFFSGCNLKCKFCQNYTISQENFGKYIEIDELANLFLKLQQQDALNINLVTPTSYVNQIIKAIKLARTKGLHLPIIYNTSSYENIDTIKRLKDYINIYLPDLKYFDDEIAIKYSNAPHYFKYASSAIEEMIKQAPLSFDKDGNLLTGVIVRHLILPGHVEDSKKILKYLYETYHDEIYISIMNQYTPIREIKEYKNLNRTLTNHEYNEVIEYAISLGISQAFIQEEGTQKTSFIPPFDLEGV